MHRDAPPRAPGVPAAAGDDRPRGAGGVGRGAGFELAGYNLGGVVMDSPYKEGTMDDEIRSLRSWDGTGKIYSEETVQMLQDEIAQLQARVTELVEQANAAYGPYQQKVNYLQNLVSMKNDALSSYAEFYGRAASFCGLPEDALPSGQTDAIILQRLAEHDEIARLTAELAAANEDAERLADKLSEVVAYGGYYADIENRMPPDGQTFKVIAVSLGGVDDFTVLRMDGKLYFASDPPREVPRGFEIIRIKPWDVKTFGKTEEEDF